MDQKINAFWLSRFLGNDQRSIYLVKSGAYIDQKNEQIQVVSGECEHLPYIHKGRFFSSVIIAPKLEFRWLTRKNALAIYEHLYRAWFQHRSKKAEGLSDDLSEKLNNRYVRTSSLEPLINPIALLVSKLQRPLEKDVLDEETYRVFYKLKEFHESQSKVVSGYREKYVTNELNNFDAFFNTVEADPLTPSQREACIIDEDNNLVIAGAGTGKTSTMVARTGYLIKSGQAEANEILILAYNKDATKELNERLQGAGGDNIEAFTFHSLGKKIIRDAGEGTFVSRFATDERYLDKFVDICLESYFKVPEYASDAVLYFSQYMYPAKNPFDFQSFGEYINYIKSNDMRALQGELVKSYGECLIANFLFIHGVQYEYEGKYNDDRYSNYRPDFHLPEYKIYIEHFGINHKGEVAHWMNQKKYTQDMEWKRNEHLQNKTTLVESFFHEQLDGKLLENLKENLEAHGVVFKKIPDERLLKRLKELGRVSQLAQLLKSLMKNMAATCINWEEAEQRSEKAPDTAQTKIALKLLKPIYDIYKSRLDRKNEIDFDDMIRKAIELVKEQELFTNWKYILVDEFQDISRPRALLVKALLEKSDNCSLFCVGDDWQAIYRFSGSDISYVTEFENEFGPTKVSILGKTFRFNNQICDVASRFIQKNPSQIKKDLTTNTHVDLPAVSVIKRAKHRDSAHIDEILSRIDAITEEDSSVYILTRYKKTLKWPDIKSVARNYPKLDVSLHTIHKSKGMQADFVIIAGLVNGNFGFPSERVTHPLLEVYLPPKEALAYAEERRLFYVALTRAKQRVYLLSDMTMASSFLTELLNDKSYKLCLDEFDTGGQQEHCEELSCPECEVGTLVRRENEKTGELFVGCTSYPICQYSESGCTKCQSPLIPESRQFKICISCSKRAAKCSRCSGHLLWRQNSKTEDWFWGCSNYGNTKCKGSAKKVDFENSYVTY